MSNNDSISKVGKICKAVLRLTEEDFDTVEAMAEEQMNYVHPLKVEKAHNLHRAGNYNLKVIAMLKDLQKLMRDNDPNR